MSQSSGNALLSRPRVRRGRADPLIALINVVFLLLIFLMIAGTIAPGLSDDVALVDTSDADARTPPNAAVILIDGRIMFGGAEISADAYAAAQLADGIDALRIVPDRNLPAQRLVEVVTTLRAAGAAEVFVVTERGL